MLQIFAFRLALRERIDCFHVRCGGVGGVLERVT